MPSKHNTNTDDEERGTVNDGVTRRDALRVGAGAAVAVAGASTVGSAAAQTALGGSGTESDPYLIESVEDLDAVRNDLSAHYNLTSDIDLSGTDWEPIGSASTGFTGTFDGNGHVVNGLTIDTSSTDYVGLFAYAGEGAEIRGLTLSDVDIEGRDYVAALAGYTWRATVSNITLESVTVTGRERVGGVVGQASSTTVTTVCASAVSVHPNDTAAHTHGAIAGALLGPSVLRDTYAAGTIDSPSDMDATSRAGGAVGILGGLIDTVQTDVTVTAHTTAGGVAGDIDPGQTGSDRGVITATASVGDVTITGGNSAAGGIAGNTDGLDGQSRVSDVRSLSDVSAPAADSLTHAAGIVGDPDTETTVERVYYAGSVSAADGSVGGAVAEQHATVTAVYFEDGAVDGTPVDGSYSGVTSVTTDALTGSNAQDTLTDFDWGDVWTVVPGGYPALTAQPPRDCAPDPNGTETTTEPAVGGGVAGDDASISVLSLLPWGVAALIGLAELDKDDGGDGK